MKKRPKATRDSKKRLRRLSLSAVVIAAMASLAIGAVATISRQTPATKEDSKGQVKSAAARNYVTVKVAGQDVQVDSRTGQMRELTPEEAQKLAAGLKRLINQSTEDLPQVRQPDGSVTMELQGRFQNVTVARVNEDGTLSESCVDNPRAAGEFFGIDPQMIDSRSNGGGATKQPSVMPVHSEN